MAKILTRDEFLSSLDQIITDVCADEGLDKTEFLQALADASGMHVEVV